MAVKEARVEYCLLERYALTATTAQLMASVIFATVRIEPRSLFFLILALICFSQPRHFLELHAQGRLGQHCQCVVSGYAAILRQSARLGLLKLQLNYCSEVRVTKLTRINTLSSSELLVACNGNGLKPEKNCRTNHAH